ncbi:helix-turn-helix domain-containing protein [Gimesia panareensis]|uniref:helix-turn-helix domain-containing protein n=1 Tax=Gimesia panareensis TaxID=2527978 RepID=UPI0011895D45|nr:helix-turn-helix domain-containing protein [Gimesia panareensis]QDU51639.1 Melibiose operon regulatory protein [Gimesia panareensis]
MPERFNPHRKDFEPYGLSFTHWQSTPMTRPNRHNEIELNYVLTAPLTYLIGGRKLTVEPGQIAMFWAAIPHQTVEPVYDDIYYVSTIPLSMFLEFQLGESLVQALLHGHVLEAEISAVISEPESRFETWISDLQSRSGTLKGAAILELRALLMRFEHTVRRQLNLTSESPLVSLQQTEVSAVEQMAAFIALHHAEPLTVDEISSAAGLASGYAMTIYKKVFGQTMMESLLEHRLAHAQRLLINSNDQILSIAFAAGFGSLSRFNTVFKQHCGCSPRQYRKQHFVEPATES